MGATVISNCTIYGNSGDGIYFISGEMVNSIVWNNSLEQISGSPDQVTYCDVMGGWPGAGNIDLYPEFVYTTWNDFRLQWGSPCIDAGDPDPLYNDPDGTIADMGAFYYDQSIPVRILLTPHGMPIQIPAIGGSYDYTIWATNIDPVSQLVDVWCDASLPNGSTYGPVLGPVSVTLDSGVTISRERTQTVPAGAPAGMYSYNAFAIAGIDTSTDSFPFVKMGLVELDGSFGWENTGESFDEWLAGGGEVLIPDLYSLDQNYPNPFNPYTTIRFGLPKAGQVRLYLYNLLGQRVVQLVDGYRGAGYHEVTFDGSGMASGMYIYRIEAGDYNAVRKVVLVK
jgi:hypothetical protein